MYQHPLTTAVFPGVFLKSPTRLAGEAPVVGVFSSLLFAVVLDLLEGTKSNKHSKDPN